MSGEVKKTVVANAVLNFDPGNWVFDRQELVENLTSA